MAYEDNNNGQTPLSNWSTDPRGHRGFAGPNRIRVDEALGKTIKGYTNGKMAQIFLREMVKGQQELDDAGVEATPQTLVAHAKKGGLSVAGWFLFITLSGWNIITLFGVAMIPVDYWYGINSLLRANHTESYMWLITIFGVGVLFIQALIWFALYSRLVSAVAQLEPRSGGRFAKIGRAAAHFLPKRLWMLGLIAWAITLPLYFLKTL